MNLIMNVRNSLKKKPSVVCGRLLLISCKKKIVFFNNSWPGRAHDARMWNRSPIKELLPDLMLFDNQRIDETYYLIADSAYPMSNHLMAPYKSRGVTLSDAQKIFNTHLASKRSVVERAFGLLGLRFPWVTFLPFRSNNKRIQCVVACCVLHNWCLIEDDDNFSQFELLSQEQELATDVNDNIPANIVLTERRSTSGGVTKRDILCGIVSKLP